MKSTHSLLTVSLVFMLTVFFWSCGTKEEPAPEDENELITTVRLNFTENGTTTVQKFEWKDIDGDGGNAPAISKVTLKANRTYKLEIEFLDESKTPADNITAEVKAKQDEHLVVFSPTPSSLLTYTAGDKDSRNFPIGLTGNTVTGNANQGTLRVQLRHQPPVNGQPVKNGTVTPGSDDVNITFDVSIAP
ncbi:hypothetical protein [Runella sp.]|uniref:hypothetical protein n=1 Tax=Runella sp. TaxID=1960881 RepID=UPI003D0EBE94